MKKIVLLLLISLLIINTAWAEKEVKNITYQECVSIALQNNPQIEYLNEEEREVAASYIIAASSKKIQIDASMRTVEVDDGTVDSNEIAIPGVDTDYGVFAGLTASYGIFIPGRVPLINISKSSVYLTKVNAKKKFESIISVVQNNYYNLLMARDRVKVTKTILDKYEVLLKKQRIRAEAGEVRTLDLNKVEVSYDQYRLDYEKAKQDESNAELELLLSMGIEQESGIIVPDDKLELRELKYTYEELLKMAYVMAPDLTIAKINKEINHQKVIAAQQEHLPTIGAFLSLGYENLDIAGLDNYKENFTEERWDPAFHAGVTISLPLYSGGAISAKVDRAKAGYKKAILEEERAQLLIRKNLKVYYEKINFLKRQILISEKTLENARRGLDITERSYDAGMVDLYQLNSASENVIKTETIVLNYKVNYIKTVTSIAHLIGVNEVDICLN